MLEVYTHKSLDDKPGAVTADEHGGSSRLALLGEKVLQSVVMVCLFRRQPMYNAGQLNVSRLPTVTIVSGHSRMLLVGVDCRVYFQDQRRPVGDWLQPEEQSPVCSRSHPATWSR